mgnify:CR=1 FL=1
MAAVKSILKTMRLSEDVIDYINSQPGDSFTGKFETMIYQVRYGQKERLARLNQLDDWIAQKENRFDQISKDLKALEDIKRQIGWVSSSVNSLVSITKQHVIQDTSRDPPAEGKL